MPINVPPSEASPSHKITEAVEHQNSEPKSSPPTSQSLNSQPRRSVSPGGSIVGRFICQSCGEINAAATPHSNISRTAPLPRESVLQKSPSAFPTLSVPSGDSIPSLIPADDYVVQKGMFKVYKTCSNLHSQFNFLVFPCCNPLEGSKRGLPTHWLANFAYKIPIFLSCVQPDNNEYKSAFSPMDKRWYSVLFPALQVRTVHMAYLELLHILLRAITNSKFSKHIFHLYKSNFGMSNSQEKGKMLNY